MKQKLQLLALSIILLLAACAPTATQSIATVPIVFESTQEEIYSAVLRAITVDPGVASYGGGLDYQRAASGPWIITSSDRVGGFISAVARSSAATFIGSANEPDVHQLSVVVSSTNTNPPRTQVVVQGTARADLAAARVLAQLDRQFTRVQ